MSVKYQTYSILVNNINNSRYNKLGYVCKPGDTIIIKWEDTPTHFDIEYKCIECGKECISKKHVIDRAKYKFTCRVCIGKKHPINIFQDITGQKFNRLTVISFNSTKGTSDKKETFWNVKCDCGVEKVIRARALKTNRTYSCGCYYKEITENSRIQTLINYSKTHTGSKHHNYKPELSDEDRQKRRNDTKIAPIRNKVFERDNYICQCCKKTNTVLNAHHILPYSTYKELRYNLNNLTTLCYNCHIAYHSKYKKNINQETLNEFRKETNFVG